MIETVGRINILEVSGQPHIDFSLQSGHFLRSRFWQLQRQLSYRFPSLYMRHIPDSENVVRGWLTKRNMFLDPRDGRC